MNRLILAPLALLAIPLTGAGQSSPGSFSLTNATSAQVAEAYKTKKPGAPIATGQWERRYEIKSLDLPDMPAGPDRDARIAAAKAEPKVESFCQEPTTEQSAPEPAAVFEMMGEQCVYDRISMGGGKFDAVARCKSPEGLPVSNTITGTYDTTSFMIHMNLEMTYPAPAGRVKLAMDVSGRRTGVCTK
ncbi:DUF3617 family protein [Sphingomonas sp. AOB5]|uniref:DUF3617 domain-containing protein n=1 Tax=Sphingomonas sp. AOB5 TaxID=3034017 RepID=UPI0023F8CCB9|nr:DUF3617 family protein [Sphingomonas sp. AOB5]MDF7776626.1 DUF3617 family protein [Sphingomonas sp. AOB5]